MDAKSPLENTWFPSLLESEPPVVVNEPVSFTVLDPTTRRRELAESIVPRTNHVSFYPSRSAPRLTATESAGKAAVEAVPETSTAGSISSRPSLAPSSWRDVREGEKRGDAITYLMGHVSKLEEENRQLHMRIQKLEERDEGRKASVTENGTEKVSET